MSENTTNTDSIITRRNFAKKTTVAGTALGLGTMAFPMLNAAENATKKKLKIGVVGLGGRGGGAVHNILAADPDTVLWAAGDIFEKQIKRCDQFEKQYGNRVDLDGGKRRFVGFDSYQKVIDSGVDIVLLTSTPIFRPLHFEAAIAAGKHAFIEKPFALDIPGLLSIIESAKKAKTNGLSVLTGLVWRYSSHLAEMNKRVMDGAIGDILTVSSAYSSGGRPNKMPDPKFKPPNMSDMEWSLRYWQNFLELSGDGILEFMIHGIDRMIWHMGDAMPVKCYAVGANLDPVPGANAWDHSCIRYEYADGRHSDFFGRQLKGAFTPSGDVIVGTKGKAVAQGRNVSIQVGDKTIWKSQGGLGYVEEHKILTSHIRAGKIFNDIIDQTANSHAAGIMGRSAGYTAQMITDEQLFASKDEFIKDVKNLNFETPFTARKSPIPGKTKFA